MSSAALTYAGYLQLDKILTAQTPKSDGPEHDEMLFIIIHQVYELWFKQLLHELDYLSRLLRANDQPRALHTLRRMLTILKTVVAQIDVLETMTPLEFNSFRGYLETASGFQSIQFRELEFALGHKRLSILEHFPTEMAETQRLRTRYEQPTLWDAFLTFLSINGCAIPAEQLERDVTQPIRPSPETQAALIKVYQQEPWLVRVCERLIDLDEGIQEWRYRHVKMVQRTIGTKKGTGGSAGVKYLQTTLNPAFPDLWA
ncbi:MAG: tryptophan 2,3-dioxygenase family protein, partial [Anaerolineae bacterium]|nr:tryptophan 2,3-dioxygenase family protein [Anaerolineae bacterium]